MFKDLSYQKGFCSSTVGHLCSGRGNDETIEKRSELYGKRYGQIRLIRDLEKATIMGQTAKKVVTTASGNLPGHGCAVSVAVINAGGGSRCAVTATILSNDLEDLRCQQQLGSPSLQAHPPCSLRHRVWPHLL